MLVFLLVLAVQEKCAGRKPDVSMTNVPADVRLLLVSPPPGKDDLAHKKTATRVSNSTPLHK